MVNTECYGNKTVLLTGATGFLGRVVAEQLRSAGATVVPYRHDLIQPVPSGEYPAVDLIIHLAAQIAGIGENAKYPYGFLRSNTAMSLHLVDYAVLSRTPVVAAGSVCVYPQWAEVPFSEEDIWNGRPEPSNYGYGTAKRLLLSALACAAEQYSLPYCYLVCANLYGPGDHLGTKAHVIPALLEKIVAAVQNDEEVVNVWGSGRPSRDFLYVKDAARAYVLAGAHLLAGGANATLNIGSGQDITIAELAEMLAEICGYTGQFRYDTFRPDGQMRRRSSTTRAKFLLGWQATTPLRQGLEQTVAETVWRADFGMEWQ